MRILKLSLFTAALTFGLTHSAIAVTPTVYDMMVDGVRVIVQPTKANQIIAVDLGIQGGYALGETGNPAVPGMMAGLTTVSGSAKYPKDKYRELLSSLVTSISGNASAYGATFSLTCARPKFDQSWKIFEDVIQEPLYDHEEFTKLDIQALTQIAGRRQEPESWVNFMLDSIWSAGHAAGRVVQPEDIKAISIGDLHRYHDQQLERSRMTIVIVGDVTKAEVQKKVHELLTTPSEVPLGSFVRKPFEKISGPGKTDIVVDARELPTTYIVGRFVGPARTDPDYWPTRVAASILSDRLYEQVRTKRNLSYSPYAYFGGSEGAYYEQVGVSTTNPDSAMHVITRELRKMSESGVTAKELRDTKESMVTQIYMSQQSNLAQAARLYTAQMETGDYRTSLHTLDVLSKVTEADINRALAKYLHTIYWTAVGDQAKITRTDFMYP